MAIDYFSASVVKIEMWFDGGQTFISSGTAFAINASGGNFLITNWHNVTGLHADTLNPLDKGGRSFPDFIRAWFHSSKFGNWIPKDIRLMNENRKPLYRQYNPGNSIDVVAIPFEVDDRFSIYPIDLNLANTNLKIYPSKAVSIIGFPNNENAGGMFPIWKKGHIASEPEINYDGKPIFLVDATTRGGMSGSPVVILESGMVEMSNHGIAQGTFRKFLGIYSGRIDRDSEIGRVWKPEVIMGLT